MTRRRDTVDWPEFADTVLRALDNAGIGMTVTSRDEAGDVEYLYANDAAGRALNVSADELTSRPAMSFVAPEEHQRIREIGERSEQGTAPQNFELAAITGDGRRVTLELGVATTTYRDRPVTVSFTRDVTARRANEEAVRESESRFRQLAEMSPDSIAVIADGRFVWANPTTARIFGFDTVEQFLARPMTEMLDADEAERLRERMVRVLGGERLAPAEYRVYRRDRSQITIEVSSIAIEFEGRPAILGIARDVTARKQLQADLVQAERMAAVGTLAAGVAHEINNPLTYVLLRLQRLRRTLPDLVGDAGERDSILSQLDDVIDGSDRVAEIVRDLLSFARSDTEDVGPVDLESVLQSVVKLATTTTRHTARVVCDFGGVGIIRGSRAKLGQVFLNLVVNAAQAFEHEDPCDNWIGVSTRRTRDGVEVEICDNGCGIPESHLSRIFEPFFTTKSGRGGTGLGLAITRSIVEAIGGRIEVDGRAEGGTRFLVWLPATGDDDRRPARPPAPSPAPPPGARILVVDDEQLICNALASLLRQDHEVATETSSERALARLIDEAPFDVVFCDLAMPALMGQELFERVCAQRPEYASRFVFITGGATTASGANFIASNRAAIIAKPFTPEDIDQALERVRRSTSK